MLYIYIIKQSVDMGLRVSEKSVFPISFGRGRFRKMKRFCLTLDACRYVIMALLSS